eukprot:scaffold1033_cov205-Alexandrium_tamarense.AAC.12
MTDNKWEASEEQVLLHVTHHHVFATARGHEPCKVPWLCASPVSQCGSSYCRIRYRNMPKFNERGQKMTSIMKRESAASSHLYILLSAGNWEVTYVVVLGMASHQCGTMLHASQLTVPTLLRSFIRN